MSKFTINASPSTDVWRKPPDVFSFNAPTAKTVQGSLKSFQRARITVILPHVTELVKYDQGGILFSITKPGQDPATAQWVKSGIEYYLDRPWVGTVCCDRWADWSIASIEMIRPTVNPTATVELERLEEDGKKSLWVYLVVVDGADERRVPLREVSWIFADEDHQELEISISAYAARPQKKPGNEEEELEVSFDGLQVEWRE